MTKRWGKQSTRRHLLVYLLCNLLLVGSVLCQLKNLHFRRKLHIRFFPSAAHSCCSGGEESNLIQKEGLS